jgi:hypothetical protein
MMHDPQPMPTVRSTPIATDIEIIQTFFNVIWRVIQILNVKNKDPISQQKLAYDFIGAKQIYKKNSLYKNIICLVSK